LHLHLEGAVPWHLIRAWSPDPLPERPDWWDLAHRYGSFAEFITVVRPCWKPYLDCPERIHDAAAGVFGGLIAQNVRYVELSFGLGAYDFPVADVVSPIKQARPDGLEVRVIAGISRDRDLDWMRRLAAEALNTDGLDGIDLHGDEGEGRLEDFVSIFREAEERGLITKAHAGEFGRPETVRATVERLGVQRIEHGIAAAGDANVVQFLKDRDVVLDVCPWSNVKLGASESLRAHPVRALHRAGVRLTAGTDDPTAFGQTLTDELAWLGTEAGMTEAEVFQVMRNGFSAAALPPAARDRWTSCIDAVEREAL
jgi:adenosine deaminase